MKLKIIVISILIGQVCNQAQAFKTLETAQKKPTTVETASEDTVRDEFKLKKKNTDDLIRGKSSETMLTYYRLYLEEKDQNRADTLMYGILRRESAVYYRYNISLISYSYTSDTKTKMLFLSDPDRLREYRTYFLQFDISTLKSNNYIRAHYYNMVALDSIYYKTAPDSLVKLQMARHYNSLAWYSILTQKLNNVEYFLNQSIKYDPRSKYPYSNLPLLFLLNKHYKKAKDLYLKYRDQPFDKSHRTYKDEFLEDFRELEKVGITNHDIKKITRLLFSSSR
jgi:hypothetical protein